MEYEDSKSESSSSIDTSNSSARDEVAPLESSI